MFVVPSRFFPLRTRRKRTALQYYEPVDMSATTTSIASVLNSLIETCKDGQDGFQSASAAVKNPDYKSLFVELAVQRQQFVTELQGLVSALGEQPEEDGTVPAVFHRGWMDLKAAILGGDVHTVLVECERGEEAAVATYLRAVEAEDLTLEIRDIVHRQSLGIQAARDRIHDLRAQLEGN